MRGGNAGRAAKFFVSCRGGDFFLPHPPVILLMQALLAPAIKAASEEGREEEPMGECREITLDEILADPIVLLVMAADGIDPAEFESNLRAVKRDRGAGEAAETEASAL